MNTHAYENLGDDYFQMLCQALISQEYPGLQCYPVNMPDGGRDAHAPDSGSLKGGVVFQVKLCRKPATISDSVEWLCRAVTGELEKVNRLVERGIGRYILVTNLRGTSHLDAGSIDRVQGFLDETLPVPAQCWWRDDLDRRLERSFDLKLRYPAVMSGADLLHLAWDLLTRDDSDSRRRDALNAYLGYHYDEDSTVRFKQIELVSTALLDLFIDVPAVPQQAKDSRQRAKSRLLYLRTLQRSVVPVAESESPSRAEVVRTSDGVYLTTDGHGYREASLGGAELLTDPEFTSAFPFVVVEGAPGQGKSTLTQYLAQLQRARLLPYCEDGGTFPEKYLGAPMAMPFRLELRDLATWLRGFDPWDQESFERARHEKQKTLEAALAANVERYSGGIVFDVADLARVLKATPAILLLDALDEVADMDDRAAVVSAVQEAMARFAGNGIGLQVIVTSRPTAIAGSPKFPDDQFLYLSLAPLNLDHTLDYAEKWARARRMNDADRQRLPATLREKLRAPHIGQLARNTMQLSILLSLVQRRGASLPDKRTELYTAYFDIFLDRESEKNESVRDNRTLLFDIHRYLGYYLHSIAEGKKASARIRYQELKTLLGDYLSRERQPYTLVDTLLSGMVERFGALVSRVQGRYEFEVQPLQEYFAAKYLNDTAPSSTPGRECRGTKSDRFDGIAGNPYWFNVSRFLAGCFSKGELADLADRVCDLIEDPAYAPRTLSRGLGVALLQDWVFSQSRRATRRVVRASFDDLGIVCAAHGQLDSHASQAGLALPKGGGAEDLAEVCWERLMVDQTNERIGDLCGLLRRNGDPLGSARTWHEEFQRGSRPPRHWLGVGARLGVARHLTAGELVEIDRGLTDEASVVFPSFAFVNGAQLQDLPTDLSFSLFRRWLDSSGVRGQSLAVPGISEPLTYLVAWLTEPWNWIARASGNRFVPDSYVIEAVNSVLASRNSSAVGMLEDLAVSARNWWSQDMAVKIDPWVDAVAALEERFGITWRSIALGVAAGMIRNPAERGRGSPGLFDRETPLPFRVRYARRFAKDASWWREQRAGIEASVDHGLWCMVVAVWASGDCFSRLISEFDNSLKAMSAADRDTVLRLIDSSPLSLRSQSLGQAAVDSIEGVSSEAFAILSRRFRNGGGLVSHLLGRVDSQTAAETCLSWLCEKPGSSLSVADRVGYIKEAVANGGTVGYGYGYGYGFSFPTRVRERSDLAKRVLDDPWSMPGELVVAASAVGSRRRRHRSVSEIADAEEWFVQDEADC